MLSSIEAFTDLQTVGGYFGLYYLNIVETVAFPELTTVGGGISIRDNTNLLSLSRVPGL
ncbi:MAG: hypothetical protein GY847_09615 [Proteobacteria bacterium]|nr:hypothetical protein [Pseudomonadota bacterium]